VVKDPAYCLDLKRQVDLVEQMRGKGFQQEHPLVAQPLRRAIVIRRLADNADHAIPDDGPCAKCKAVAQ